MEDFSFWQLLFVFVVTQVVYWIGYAAGYLKAKVDGVPTLEDYEAEEEAVPYVEIDIEKKDGILYVYESESGKFLTQADNFAEIQKNLTGKNIQYWCQTKKLKEILPDE